MSFGFSVGDFVVLTQLAYTVVQNSRKACGAHDELTREVTTLHIVLQRLQREVEKSNSLINRADDGRLEELQTIVRGCDRMLKVIDQVLVKYNGMLEEKRRVTRFRLKVKFGNGEMKDIGKIRQELATYTSAITLFLNLLTMGSQGKVEEYMESHGEDLRELRQSLNWITATLQASSGNREGSILTTYADDDKAIWKEFRRELLKEGFSSDELRRNKGIIKKYVVELGARGALDVPEFEESIVEMEDPVEEPPRSRNGKEVERERALVIESTPSRIENLDSLSEREVSTVRLENHIVEHEQPVENTTQILSSLMQPTDPFKPVCQISTGRQQVVAFPIAGELGEGASEAKEDEQGGSGNSTSILTKDRKWNQLILQSAHASDSDGTNSEAGEESLDKSTETVQTAPGASQINIPIRSYEGDADPLPSITRTELNPEPVSIEEVEDEDFRPGAHPNCGERETLIDGYDTLTYSDGSTTGSSHYEDDGSDGVDSSSSYLSPEDWRNTPAPLWREVERMKYSAPSDAGYFYGPPSSENHSDRELDSRAQPPFNEPSNLDIESYTTKTIVEQFGFDPFRNTHRNFLGLSNGAQQGDGDTATTSWRSDSSHTSDLMPDIPRMSSTNVGQNIALTAAALQQIPEDSERLLYQSKATLSTREVHPETKRGHRRVARYRNQDSESEEDLSRWRDLSADHLRRGYARYSAVYTDEGRGIVDDNGDCFHYGEGSRQAFSPRYSSTGYYATTAPERAQFEDPAGYYTKSGEI